MPDVFTLFELQKTVEAILGPHLHKQNFRRLVEGGGLVEPTGEHRLHTGGRPARLYRFRRDVLLERLAPGRPHQGRAKLSGWPIRTAEEARTVGYRSASMPPRLTTCRSFSAAPVGRRSPRSHWLTVLTATFMNAASTA